MKVSTKTQYGLRAMIFLAKFGNKTTPLSLREISKKEGIPLDYLEKIMTKLKNGNLIKSKKGLKGGYFLKKTPENIKVLEIVEVLEGKPKFAKCFESFCQKSKNCKAKILWDKLQRSINLTLSSITLKDLIK